MLTDIEIRRLKPKEKSYMIRDDNGLYLEVMPNGNRYWRVRYWADGKEHKRSLGSYPAISLREARVRRDEIKIKLHRGEDPFVPDSYSFQNIAQEWYETKILPICAPGHSKTVQIRLKTHLYPYLGNIRIREITARDLLQVIRRIEKRGHYETAHRVLQICGQVFRYAIASAQADRDPSADLKGALVPVSAKHHPTITEPEEIGALLRAIDDLNGYPIVHYAVMFGILTFVRPGELRNAEWSEVDLGKKEWRIPAGKMKMRRPHIVPLSKQATEILDEVRFLTGRERFVFPSTRSFDRPMSENTVNAALRRMGYAREDLTGHGFRAMASTILNEQGWPADAIERQLAHVEGNSVRAAYNYAEHLDVRRKMMQAWADWLDGVR